MNTFKGKPEMNITFLWIIDTTRKKTPAIKCFFYLLGLYSKLSGSYYVKKKENALYSSTESLISITKPNGVKENYTFKPHSKKKRNGVNCKQKDLWYFFFLFSCCVISIHFLSFLYS